MQARHSGLMRLAVKNAAQRAVNLIEWLFPALEFRLYRANSPMNCTIALGPAVRSPPRRAAGAPGRPLVPRIFVDLAKEALALSAAIP